MKLIHCGLTPPYLARLRQVLRRELREDALQKARVQRAPHAGRPHSAVRHTVAVPVGSQTGQHWRSTQTDPCVLRAHCTGACHVDLAQACFVQDPGQEGKILAPKDQMRLALIGRQSFWNQIFHLNWGASAQEQRAHALGPRDGDRAGNVGNAPTRAQLNQQRVGSGGAISPNAPHPPAHSKTQISCQTTETQLPFLSCNTNHARGCHQPVGRPHSASHLAPTTLRSVLVGRELNSRDAGP